MHLGSVLKKIFRSDKKNKNRRRSSGPSRPRSPQSQHVVTSGGHPSVNEVAHAPATPPSAVSVVDRAHNIESATFREGNFSNAQNVRIGIAYMNDYSRTDGQTEEEKQVEKALEKLAEKGMPGAMLHSKEREYAPRCDEDTRQTLRAHIVDWGQQDGDIRPLLWLYGPAAVGKSAIAQTVAEELQEEDLLGAVFFFSRPNNRSDPDVVIPTLVYQLAQLLPDYRRLITRRIIQDPLILSSSRRIQFQELIINPFLTLASHRPLLIVLDGLDECNSRDAQCEFVEMISYHLQRESSLRLRCLICSRPEPHLKVAFSSEDCEKTCFQLELEVDDIEAQEDARRILETGFAEIRRRYTDQLPEDWPDETQVNQIADRASGHLGFVAFIVRFIGDMVYDDPAGQLEICLRFLERARSPDDLNPLHSLDLLYTQILSDIPKKILPTTRRILGLFIFHGNEYLTAAAHANFLGLDQTSFYRALQRLHSVLLIPSASEASKKSIQIYHASFSDYLKDTDRSKKFALEEGVVPPLDIAVSGLKWLAHGRKNPLDQKLLPKLTWLPPKTDPSAVLDSLLVFSFTPCWKACPRVPAKSLPILIEALEKLDFDLQYSGFETPNFVYFIQWLFSLGTRHRSLIDITNWNTNSPDPERQGTALYHLHDDPYSFVAPFLAGAPRAEQYTIHFQLGKLNPFPFCLYVCPKDYAFFYSSRQ